MMSFFENKWIKSLFLVLLVFLAFGYYFIDLRPINASNDIPITPNDEFFTNAIDFFDIDPVDYRLVVAGEVGNPLSLSLDEIKSLPVASEIVRLTCIEHTFGRSNRTGVANWTGVKLSTILGLASINLAATNDISFHTPDLSPNAYSTSLKPEEAYWDDVILAYEMNSEPLPKEHGYPLRLVCPRFFGYKWIKWVAYINATAINYQGFWETRGYSDSPYVEGIVDLPIYYPLTAESEMTSESGVLPTSRQKNSEVNLGIFFLALAILTFSRLRKKQKKDSVRLEARS
ncbi:MAG: molybdopterin-dependent oxidoreductase [Candidatus Hodarchaeota archaeon]